MFQKRRLESIVSGASIDTIQKFQSIKCEYIILRKSTFKIDLKDF